jgi:hypothetical protein
MKATFTSKETRNGVNFGDKKELIRAKSVIALQTNGHPCEVISARWYMGRSASASIVYCTVWVNGGLWVSGSGSAGGGGYCKQSAAFAHAVENAGIELTEDVAGRGSSAVESACKAIARELGFSTDNLLFVSH